MLAIGWRWSLVLVGLLGLPVVVAILLQSRVLKDQVREAVPEGGELSGRALLMSPTMLLFFGFFTLGAMAGGGVQSWLVTVLHTVNGLDLAAASTALTGYMVGATLGVLVGGWFADRYRAHVLRFAVVLTMASAGLVLVVAWLGLPGAAIAGVMFASGVALGASRTPRDMMVREAAPPGQIGKVFGFVSAGLPLGSAVTPVPFGFLIDRGHPELVLVAVAVILLLSLLCVGTARSSARREVIALAAE